MSRPARWLYVDATEGASGDMILGALVDLGVPLAHLRRVLATLPIDGWSIRSRRASPARIIKLSNAVIQLRLSHPLPWMPAMGPTW